MDTYVNHVWLGLFGPSAPDSYFVQDYTDDKKPRCQFAAEQGEHSFDYDFVEISFPIDPLPVRALVDGHSYSDSYLDLVDQKARELDITQVNVFVLASKEQFSAPRTVIGSDYQLWYLGEFSSRG